MNFLAHLHLSDDKPLIMVGNFIGDWVKGRAAAQVYEREVQVGISLHRTIDDFTDRHPVVKRSKKRLFGNYRHYSGVIVDVFYDHFLAAGWSQYRGEPLDNFAARCYDILHAYHMLPEDVKRMLPYMINGNWLLNYSKVEGVHRALSGMASRTPFKSGMENASNDLVEHYQEFSSDFAEFFPELQSHVSQFLKTAQF